MATASLVPLEEYLETQFQDGDREYIDGQVAERIDDYLGCGVRFVWVVNPRTRLGWVPTTEGSREAKDGLLRTAEPALEVPLAELFG